MADGPTTADLIKLIGTPFLPQTGESPSDEFLAGIFEKAFHARVAPLYLHMYRAAGWSDALEEKFRFVNDREIMTQSVLSDISAHLNDLGGAGYVIFKSIKPYPAIPNDTDVLILGDKHDFRKALGHLYSKGYMFHERAPLQTTLYDPRGKGKIGKGKKGGTYYLDIYREISTDYFCYLSKEAILPYIVEREINGIPVRLMQTEPELAIILFHNVFPERTFELEHFYMPLYNFHNPAFDMDLFITFVEDNFLTRAVATNLTLVSSLHEQHFLFTPTPVKLLLDRWGKQSKEIRRFDACGRETPFMFSPRTFWTTFLGKLRDKSCIRSLLTQFLHMLNPLFFAGVVNTLRRRFSERGVYHME